MTSVYLDRNMDDDTRNFQRLKATFRFNAAQQVGKDTRQQLPTGGQRQPSES